MNPDFRMVRTTLYLPADLRVRLREVAAKRRVSTAAVMRAGLELVVESYRPEPTGGFLREGSGE